MSESRLFFVCYPDTNHPIGGVKQIYRQVEILASEGVQAWVVQQQAGFRASWFASTAPVIDLDSLRSLDLDPHRDLLVLPETWLRNLPEYFPGIPKVIFNQNAFYTFGLDGHCDTNTLELYRHPDLRGVVTVSEDSRALLVRGCGLPPERCLPVINGIDAALFHVPPVKVRRIVFLARKHAHHARKVALMASTRPALARYPFRELGSLSHGRVAHELREALVFLSCGHPEGFGLPLAEAIASGCLVVGYHGLAGRDFALPHMCPVEFGDLLGFLDALEAEVLRFEADPAAVTAERCSASEQILQRYGLEAERTQAMTVWGQLMAATTHGD